MVAIKIYRLLLNFERFCIKQIPLRNTRKKLRKNVDHKIHISNLMLQYYKHIANVKKLKARIKQNKKVRIIFFVNYAASWGAEPLFNKIKNDPLFYVKIAVIPDAARGETNQKIQINNTLKRLSLKYKDYILDNYKNNSWIDYSDSFDIAFFPVPYDLMTIEIYTIKYYCKKNVLPILIDYGVSISNWSLDHILNTLESNLCWKVFTNFKSDLINYQTKCDLKGLNVVLTGYSKMDRFSEIHLVPRSRKKIILAPHHTVATPELPMSNFLKFSNLFLELPKLFPDVDFVLRPHPLLFTTLINSNLWTKEQVNSYINTFCCYSNTEYQDPSVDYFDTFLNSDGIIHDCGSFIVEYLYTDHPACYILADSNIIPKIFNDFSQKCLEYYYHAFSKEDIIQFINNVILNEDDPLKSKRLAFAKDNIKDNFPHASDNIVNALKHDLF